MMATQEQQIQPHRFKFPDHGVCIAAGVVRGVRPEIGDLTVACLTSVCDHQLHLPLVNNNNNNKNGARFVAPPARGGGAIYGSVPFQFESSSLALLDIPSRIERSLKEELVRRGVAEEDLRRISVMAGRTDLSCLIDTEGSTSSSDDSRERAVVVDTDIVSRLVKADPRSVAPKKMLDEHRGRKMISFQTQAELFAWFLQTGFSPERRQKLQDLLADYEVIWPDGLCCLIWANLINQTRALGRPAGAQDMWVAAIAIRHGARICTANLKDFDYLPQLELLPVKNNTSARAGQTLPIQQYLREHGDDATTWDGLGQSVFVVRSEVHPSLVLLNAKQHARTGDPGNRAYGCRGLILDQDDDYRIVNYPFNSFFNLGGRQSRRIAKKFNWSSATVYPKLDGTMISLYYYNNEFRVSTRGHPDAATSVLEKDPDGKGMLFATLFWKTWEELGYTLPPQHGPWIRRTYCFELLTSANRVVVPVEKSRIVLTAVRDLDTLQELPCGPIALDLQWETVEPEPPVAGPDELRTRADNLSPVQGEGYVVVDTTTWDRLKVKSRRYVLASSLPRPNWGWTDHHEVAMASVDDEQLMKLVLAGETDEFVAYFPEWESRFMAVQAKLKQLVSRLEQLLGEALRSGGTIKEVHAWLSDRQLPSGLLGVLMKIIRELRSGETLVVPDRSRVLEQLSKEKPAQVLFWSQELGVSDATPAAAAVTIFSASADTSSQNVRVQTEVTRSWFWRPLFNDPFSISIVAFAACVSFYNGIQVRQVGLPRRPDTSFLVFPALGFCVGSRADILRCKGRQFLSKLLAWKRSQNLPQEMQRLGVLYEGVYSQKSLARIAILEGFLRRLARCSSLKYSLVLRGSLLTRQIVYPQVREAQDLDFVACFPWEEKDPVGEVLRRIRGICDSFFSDGVSFGDSSEISGVVTWGESDTPGVKVSIPSAALYGQHYQDIEIDVGFNDPLDPPPFWLSYKPIPVFEVAASFRVLAIRPELLFAWKLHGLFERNTVNELGQDIQGYWRMKDIHDLWLLARALTSDGPAGIPVKLKYISRAVEVAFAAREQDPRLISRLISREFGTSSGSQKRWCKYRRKAACPDELPAQLHILVDRVVEFMMPLLQEMLKRRGQLEMVVQAKSTTEDPGLEAQATPIESLDTTAMISELPGRWNVFRNRSRIHFEDVSYEQVLQLLKGPANSLMFGSRPEQYDLDRIKPSLGVRGGYVVVKQAPPFTMRDCTANLVSRRVTADAPLGTNTPSISIGTSREEELIDPPSSPGVELYKPETPQNEAERGAFEAGKHLLANRLARRLDVLPPLHMIVYVTSSQRKYMEAKKCLAEWGEMFVQGPTSVKPPSPSPSTSFWRGPEAAVRSMARYCYDVLQTPCLVDLTFLEVKDPAGGPPVLYSAPEIADPLSVDKFLEINHGRSAVLHSFIGYLNSSSRCVQVFEGSLEGHVCHKALDAGGKLKVQLPEKKPMLWERSTLENDFIDTVFVPEGYAQPLISMSKSSFCVGIRHVPLLELAQSLRGRDYSQLFEVHVTVETPEIQDAVGIFEKHCADLSPFGFPFAVKPVLIENSSGEVPTQMMTSSYHRGTLADVHLEAFRLSQALVRAGYVVSRTKIEVLLSSRGVPITDEEAKRLSAENYFEFHIKLRLAGDCPLEPLQVLAERHGARLSRNAMSKGVKTTETGQLIESWQLRFVNLRLYQVGRDTALEKFQACVNDLEQSGYTVEKLIREYSVYDSNVALDRGWIDKH